MAGLIYQRNLHNLRESAILTGKLVRLTHGPDRDDFATELWGTEPRQEGTPAATGGVGPTPFGVVKYEGWGLSPPRVATRGYYCCAPAGLNNLRNLLNLRESAILTSKHARLTHSPDRDDFATELWGTEKRSASGGSL